MLACGVKEERRTFRIEGTHHDRRRETGASSEPRRGPMNQIVASDVLALGVDRNRRLQH